MKTSSQHKRVLAGFSLMEMLVSIFIFSTMMVATSSIFGTGVVGYRHSRQLERDLEGSQFIINDIAKQLRTSTIVNMTFDSGAGTFASPGVDDRVQFFDYSQSRCFEYEGNSGILRKRSAGASLPGDCVASLASVTDWEELTTGHVVPSFIIVKSLSGTAVGKVTIVFVVKENASADREVRIQTTVSLRDYNVSGVL